MAVVLTNNATSLLAGAITAASTTLSIENADASKFPTPPAGDWFPVTIVDNAGNMEIMKATKREGAILTVTRAQEGTTAKAFAAGARIDLRLTAAAIFEIVPTVISGSTLDDENIDKEHARISWWDASAKVLKFSTWARLVAKLLPKSGGTLTGQLKGIDATTAEDYLASFVADSAGGAYANVPKRRAPFKAQTTTIGNSYAPVLNASYNTSAWGGVWTQGVINVGNNGQATSYQIIHMHNDGQALKAFTFAPSGEFRADGDIRAGAWVYANGRVVASDHMQAGGVVYAGNGSATFYQDGNLSGPKWGGGYLYDWIENRAYAHAISQVRDFSYAGRLSLMWVRPGGQINPNDLIAGANLRYAGLAAGGSNYDRVTVQNTYAADGTWRMLGFCGVNPFPQGNYGNLILCAKVI